LGLAWHWNPQTRSRIVESRSGCASWMAGCAKPTRQSWPACIMARRRA